MRININELKKSGYKLVKVDKVCKCYDNNKSTDLEYSKPKKRITDDMINDYRQVYNEVAVKRLYDREMLRMTQGLSVKNINIKEINKYERLMDLSKHMAIVGIKHSLSRYPEYRDIDVEKALAEEIESVKNKEHLKKRLIVLDELVNLIPKEILDSYLI